MSALNNPMAIFKLLPKTNCRECGERTCLAFAASVFKGSRSLEECPYLAGDIIARHGGKNAEKPDIEQGMDEAIKALQAKIAAADLAAAADRAGGEYRNGRLTVRTLGKPFSVDDQGRLFADIHIHRWIAIPVMRYILEGAGRPVAGRWVPLRELKGGQDWYRLFEQRCEKPLKRVADVYTDLFEDMIHLFSGKPVEKHYASDIALVLHPLPKVPLLICYWRPEEGMASSLNVFFDDTAADNLPIDALYGLVAGLVRMFEKISQRHGVLTRTAQG
jgi:hypothetical protein